MKMIKEGTIEFIQIKRQIAEKLSKLQEGYVLRDTELVEDYAKELFRDQNIVILGTSETEWCLGYDEAKELLSSDWMYWGDAAFDCSEFKLSTNGEAAWFTTHGTVSYSFEDNDEKFERYLGFVKSYLEDRDKEGKGSTKESFSFINWMLAMAFNARKTGVRKYMWPLRLSGVLAKENEKWQFEQLHFSLPVTSRFPDVRYLEGNDENEDIIKLKSKIETFKKTWNSSEIEYVTDVKNIEMVMEEFERQYLCRDIKGENIVERFFSTSEDICIVDTDNPWYVGKAEISNVVSIHRERWNKLEFSKHECLIGVNGNTGRIIVDGIVSRNYDEISAFKDLKTDIDKILNKDTNVKERMFQIQRNIAQALLETSKGNDYKWPIRMEAVFIKENETWVFHSIVFSYPFNWILEGKYDTPVL